MKTIQDKILKSDFVEWKKFKFIQGEHLKGLTKEAYQKLRESIIQNNFVESFKVWQNGENLYCLDGFHRCKVFSELEKEGWDIPEKFRGDFIKCKDKKEAAKLVLIYSGIYARVQYDGLYEFLNIQGLDFDEIRKEIDLPEIDLEEFDVGFMKEYNPENKEKEIGFLETKNECPKCGYEW